MLKTASNFYTQVAIFIAVSVLACLVACAEVPIANRRNLHLVSDSELMTLSYQQYNQVLHKSRLSTDTQEVAKVPSKIRQGYALYA